MVTRRRRLGVYVDGDLGGGVEFIGAAASRSQPLRSLPVERQQTDFETEQSGMYRAVETEVLQHPCRNLTVTQASASNRRGTRSQLARLGASQAQPNLTDKLETSARRMEWRMKFDAMRIRRSG